MAPHLHGYGALMQGFRRLMEAGVDGGVFDLSGSAISGITVELEIKMVCGKG